MNPQIPRLHWIRQPSFVPATWQDILLPEELDAILLSQHRPNFIMSVLSTAIEVPCRSCLICMPAVEARVSPCAYAQQMEPNIGVSRIKVCFPLQPFRRQTL